MYPGKYFTVNLFGSLQAADGVPGAEIGKPVFSQYSPAKYIDISCIHLNDKGYTVLFEAFYEKFFK